jgi:hypothetical protein
MSKGRTRLSRAFSQASQPEMTAGTEKGCGRISSCTGKAGGLEDVAVRTIRSESYPRRAHAVSASRVRWRALPRLSSHLGFTIFCGQ